MTIRSAPARTLAVVLVLAGLAPAALSKDKTAESRWAAVPPAVDASAEDWAGNPLQTEESAGAELAFRNDADSLYLLLIIADRAHLSTLDGTGVTVFFNASGKKSRDRGLRFFRRMVTAEELIGALERSGQALTDEQKVEFRSRPQYVLFDCEYLEKGKRMPVRLPAGSTPPPPVFKMGVDGERTILEFRLLLDGSAQAWGVGAVPGSVMKLGLEWGGMTEEMKANRLARTVSAAERGAQSDTQSQSHDSSRSRDFSGGGGSLSGTGRGAPKKYSLWFDVSLAAGRRP